MTTVATQVKAIAFERAIKRLTQGFTGREWVFAEVDRWLQQTSQRFFVLTGEPGVGKSAIAAQLTQTRKDIAAYHFCIAGESGTIQPNGVLLSLAAQLIEYFPDYAEVLANCVKPLRLSVKAEINAQTIKDSVIRGIVIENLHTQSPKEALDIVLRQALTKLPKSPEQPILILIDSLDEAVTYEGQENLVTLLSGVNDLPAWVRLIVTTRPDERRVLSHLKILKPYFYHLDDLSQKSLEDVYTYVNNRVESKVIQAQLCNYQIEAQSLVQQVTDLAKGNFLYTKVLLDDIESGGQALNDLDTLPKSLDEFYHQFLMRLRAEWETKYQIIFGILTVTKAPVTAAELINLIADNPAISKAPNQAQLNQALGVIKQFFAVEKSDDGQDTYRFFHQSLRDYLLDQNRNPDFWCSPRDGHQQIIEYYWQYHPSYWRKCDRYGLQYLVMHLGDMASLEKLPVKARKQIERMHELLEIEVNGRNAWFDAKDSSGDTLGFLADVSLAWQMAEQEFMASQSSQSIVRQCRYALITASVKSLTGNIPTELVIELLRRDLMEGMSYFQRLVLDQQLDLQVLSKLEPQILEPQLVQKLIQQVEKISNQSYQIQIQASLAQYFPENIGKILEAVKSLKYEHYKSQALTMLLPYLSLEQLSEVFEVVEEMANEDLTAQIWSLLPQYLHHSRELLIHVLTISCKFYGRHRTSILTGLAPYLPSDLLPQALKTALDAEDPETNEYLRVCSLCGLTTAPQLDTDLLEEIQKESETFDQDFQVLILSALFPHLPANQQNKILERVQALEEESYKVIALNQLLPQLHSNQLDVILQEITTLEDESLKSQILSMTAQYLPSEQLHVILQVVEKLEEETSKYLALREIAAIPHLTTDLIEAIQKQSEELQDLEYQHQLLSVLAAHLSCDRLHQVLQEVQTIMDDYYQTKTIKHLSAQTSSKQPNYEKVVAFDLPLSKRLKETQAIQDEFDRADALRVLAPELAQLPQADLHPLWIEMLHTLSSRSRRNLLSDLRELTLIISSLGTVEAIAALCHVIKDIGRQWP